MRVARENISSDLETCIPMRFPLCVPHPSAVGNLSDPSKLPLPHAGGFLPELWQRHLLRPVGEVPECDDFDVGGAEGMNCLKAGEEREQDD